MSRYGLDYYGIGYYGSDNPVSFDASPFIATPSRQGEIILSWSSPTGSWSKLVLVRNPYGYPISPWDGDQLVTVYNGADPLHYTDSDLPQGQYFYYSIFVFSLLQHNWISAGKTMALSVKDCGNTGRLYDYLPNIYKITQPYSATTADWENDDLHAFLSNFGFELDYEQTTVDVLKAKFDTQKVNGKLIPVMMNQFGKTYEPSIGLQQNRRLLRDAITLTKQKGSKEGLVGFIKDFTNWTIPVPIEGTPNPSTNGITVGHNMMLDYNDSSFEESNGHWSSLDGSAGMDNLAVLDVTSLYISSGTARLYVSMPSAQDRHFDVGDAVFVRGLPYPALNNSVTPYTVTATDYATYIEFTITNPDVALTSGYNVTLGAYGQVVPSPMPWSESTAPALFPNKAGAISSLYNAGGSTATISSYCGDSAPVSKGIPVTAGNTYTFSIYVSKGKNTARNATAKIKWFDRFGALISTSSGTAVSDNVTEFSSSSRPYVTATAPSGAYYACPGLSIASVPSYEHHYIDAAQFEQSGSATAFDEARQLHITLRANRINELLNPSFSSPLDPWVITGASTASVNTIQEPNSETFTITAGAIVSNVATITLSLPHSYRIGSSVVISGVTGTNAAKYNGVREITDITDKTFTYAVTASDSTISAGTVYASGDSLQLTASGTSVSVDSWDGSDTSQLMGIYYPNTSYSFSVYALAVSAAESVHAEIAWYDDSYTLISTSTGSSVTTSTTSWVRPYVTAEAPATAAYAAVSLKWSTTSGHKLEVDLALFENTGLVLEYFDGTSGPGYVYDLMWEGNNVGAARSHLYNNRFATQTRLFGATLEEQLPLGCTAAIYLAQPNT